jgi:hypothetical protein
VQVYVNQHDFFINRVQKNMESDDAVLSVFATISLWLRTHSQVDGVPWPILIPFPPKASQV